MKNANYALYAAPYLPTPPTQTPEVIVSASKYHHPRDLARAAIKHNSTWYRYDRAKDALFRDYETNAPADDQQCDERQITFEFGSMYEPEFRELADEDE